jgi:3-hydroxyacyl-[acyl-carrier-protein] dehydratase
MFVREKVPEIDVKSLDLTKRYADIEAIRKANPQRYEFEMLTAITEIDTEQKFLVGFKDLGEDEFWARGHIPGNPLMPGVLMCEAAAQLGSFYVMNQGYIKEGMMGLGAIESAKFKRMVRPGDRLVLVGHGLRVDRRLFRFHVRGYVNCEIAFEMIITGMPLKSVKV